MNIEVMIFHDDTSKTQSENLETIVPSQRAGARPRRKHSLQCLCRDHGPMGTECLYLSQAELAKQVVTPARSNSGSWCQKESTFIFSIGRDARDFG
jgi:hypothetical protein